MEFSHVRWRKASYSNASGGNCVEIAHLANAAVAVRDSQDPDGPKLAFTPDEWESFIGRVKEGALLT